MEPNLNKYHDWLRFLKKVRLFFEQKGYLEVFSPSIVPSGAMEAHLETFKLEGRDGELITSPEFALKKLWLSGLSGALFEISPSFRKEELGDRHLSEFTMLEFYKAGVELEELKKEIKEFFEFIFGEPCAWSEIDLALAFSTFTGFKLYPDSSLEDLKKVCDFHDLIYNPETFSWNDYYQLIFIELIEPCLDINTPSFLYNYPPQVAALAKINEQGWADRLEIFWKSVELGNGYNELFNSEDLKARWLKENDERLAAGKNPHPVDDELVEIHSKTRLKQGVGIAIGLERLFYILNESSSSGSIKVWPFQ